MTYPTHLSQQQLPNLNSHCHFLSDHISQVSHSSLCNCALETWWKVDFMWQAQGKLDLFELHNPWGLLETNHICLKDGTKKVQAGNIVEHLHSSPWTSINLLYSRQRQGQQNGQANLGARTCGFIFNRWRVHIAKALDSLCQRRTILRAVGPFGASMVVARRHSWITLMQLRHRLHDCRGHSGRANALHQSILDFGAIQPHHCSLQMSFTVPSHSI